MPQQTLPAATPHASAPTPTAAALTALNMFYMDLSRDTDPHRRGRGLERLLFDLFALHHMQPRTAYDTGFEQIDGSFIFDTDIYLLEAKWESRPATREHADVFAAKIKRKGRNTLGLFLAISGFTRGFVSAPQDGGMPFIAADRHDLHALLCGHEALPDLLSRKKRHLGETGQPCEQSPTRQASCMFCSAM